MLGCNVTVCKKFIVDVLKIVFYVVIRPPPRSTLTDALCPYTTLFRSATSVATSRTAVILSATANAGTLPPPMPRSVERAGATRPGAPCGRSEEHTSELQSLMRISYAVFCLNKNNHLYQYILISKPYLRLSISIYVTLCKHVIQLR